MVSELPPAIIVGFLLTVLLTLLLFVNAVRKGAVAIVLIGWLVVTGILSYEKVFQDTSAIPPRLMLVMVPALIAIILLLLTRKGREFTDSLDLRRLTLVHIVRLPVEIILYTLAVHKLVPDLITFAGRNFDIFSGVTAPLVYLLCFRKSEVKYRSLLMAWNIVCLLLLLNVVVHALLSAPVPFQQFAFDQPNVAVLYFPFTWLPSFIVVIVLYSQLAAIRQLTRKVRSKSGA